MRSPTMLSTAFAAIAVVAAVTAGAQYREGEPPVMQPPAPVAPFDDRAGIEAFRSAYSKAGEPRIVVFWNRPFTDDLADARVKQLTVQTDGRSDSTGLDDTTSSPDGSSKLSERKSSGQRQTVVRSGEITLTPAQRAGMAEKGAWVLEAEFSRQFDRAGVALIDRAAIMRTTHLAQSGTRGNDSRTIEAAALEGKADLLMEILMAQDASAPSGWLYRVTVKSVRTGAQLVNFVTQGLPRVNPHHAGYVATDRGFERAPGPPAPSLNDVARTLGHETMQRLAPRLAAATPGQRKR